MTVAVLVTCALAYLAAAVTARARSRGHSPASTVAFLTGLAVLAVALRDQWGPYDDETAWVHHAQHALVMGVVPPLLALGAPVTLAVQVLPTRWARRLVALLHARPMRALSGRWAAIHAPLDYYGVMAVYLLTPAYALSQTNTVAHRATHVVFLVCGLLFWAPLIGRDPVDWRPRRTTRIALVAVGVPVNVLLAVAAHSTSFAVTSQAATLFGLALIGGVARPRRERQRSPARRTAPIAIATPATAAHP